MKKLLVYVFCAAFVLSLSSLALAEMTGDEIIKKYLENTGGIENYKNLDAVMMTGKGFAGGANFNMTMIRKAPNMSYMKMDSDMFQMVAASNGEKIWQKLPMLDGYIFAEGEELQRQLESNMLNPYLDYQKRGAKANYVGEDKVKGVPAHKVEYIMATGDTTYMYFDQDNYNLLKETMPDGEILFSKFEQVNGFTFPKKMTMFQQGQRIMMVINEIEVNPEIADSLFVAPPDSLAVPDEVLEQMRQQQGQ